MNLSFSIQTVANGYVVTVSKASSMHSMGMGQSQLHVFNTPEETEAFVRQVANDFKINQADEGHPILNPAWMHGVAVTNAHPDWNQIVSHATAQQGHQETTAVDSFGHPDAVPSPVVGNVFPHNQGN